MRIVFIGSKGMGVAALDVLVNVGADIVAVVARWDDPTPGQWYPSVTRRAEEYSLVTYRPTDINSPSFVESLAKLKPDIFLTAFYPKLYKRPLLTVPRLGSLNLHFAPLPRYRGSFPGAWAIIRGERAHGVTLHWMNPGIDNGDIVVQQSVEITDQDTGQSLYAKCEEAGEQLIKESLPLILSGNIPRQKQDERDALYHDRGQPYGGVVNFGWSAQEVYNFVRALTFPPFQNPCTYFVGQKLTVLECTPVKGPTERMQRPGTVIEVGEHYARIQCSDRQLDLLKVAGRNGVPKSPADLFSDLGVGPGSVLGR